MAHADGNGCLAEQGFLNTGGRLAVGNGPLRRACVPPAYGDVLLAAGEVPGPPALFRCGVHGIDVCL
jgi:hypothetical protein